MRVSGQRGLVFPCRDGARLVPAYGATCLANREANARAAYLTNVTEAAIHTR
jgi:hypothetical protein